MKTLLLLLFLAYVNPVLCYDQPLAHMCLVKPFARNDFGLVRQYANGEARAHQGVDLIAEAGDPVYAVATSEVMIVRTSKNYGLQVIIRSHSSGYYYMYAHLSHVTVRAGTIVSSGSVIGHVGMSGNADFPHLHFEMRTELLPGKGLTSRLNPKHGIGTAYLQCD